MTWQADQPYNDLPLLPPSRDIESRRVLKAAIEARAALAALDQAARRIPNPAVLLNSLPLLEAQASSEIENIVTTTDDLFTFAQDESAAPDSSTKETLRYRAALFAGIERGRERPLTVNTVIDVCSTILDRDVTVRRLPGTYIGNPATRRAVYTPPFPDTVIIAKLQDWERFLHADDDLDPLVRMAIAHYQFEAIHPFDDGNGRSGRIANILQLVGAGLLTHPVLYLSRFFIEHRDDYYRLLLAVTVHGAWEEWIAFVLDGVRRTALSTVAKIDAITALQTELTGAIRVATKAGANADLLAVVFEQPYCRIANVVDRCGVARQTAASWLDELVAAGILTDRRRGRARLFVNTRFVELLTRDEGS